LEPRCYGSRGGRGYDRVEVAFLKEPGGGKAEVLIDGTPTGSIDLDGTADERATLELRAPATGTPVGFREIAVRALTDAPVTVTGVDVGREGDGVSYLSLGFPGATVQCLQRLTTENLADDLRRMAPDYVVLAFGTNEGFDDGLDLDRYTQRFRSAIAELQRRAPQAPILVIGTPDGNRVARGCAPARCGSDAGECTWTEPPKLAGVRDVQRRIAGDAGWAYWDWFAAMGGSCSIDRMAGADPALATPDHVHLTKAGYEGLADTLFGDLMNAYSDWKARGPAS